tara:strand:- start:343 stop:1626 length:1284 start_codon:yes stop_codon:yes gene_type:complete
MILTYRIFTILIYPFLILYIYYRKLLRKEDPERFKEKILVSHFKVNKKNSSKLVWFHASSIGEFKSIIPIINQLNFNNKYLKFLITTTTLSSGYLARIELKKFSNVEHRFLPLDVDFLMDKFIHLWNPDKIFLVDSEIWPNLILKSKKYKIPIAVINARLTSRSFNRWMMFPKLAKKIFGIFNLCICSNSETKNYLEKLNVKNVHFNGNIKLINDFDEKKIRNINEHILLKKRFWLAASTHKEEDIFCLKTHLSLKKKFKDLITIIAPRHIERTMQIKNLSEKFNLNVQVLNKDELILDNKEIIIINFFGELINYYKYSKSVFMGKSMIKKLMNESGQNPIEAAKLKCKIYHGPFVYNFKEIYEILGKNKISKKIENFEELSNNLIIDLENPIKLKDESINSIRNLSDQTLKGTMKLVNNFLFNDSI